jgi:hypothetical protein
MKRLLKKTSLVAAAILVAALLARAGVHNVGLWDGPL